MLHFTPIFFSHLSPSPFSCLFLSPSTVPSHQPPVVHLSLFWLHHFSFSLVELSVISRGLCATSASLFFFFFLSPAAVSFQYNSRSPSFVHFPLKNLLSLVSPHHLEFQSKGHGDVVLSKNNFSILILLKAFRKQFCIGWMQSATWWFWWYNVQFEQCYHRVEWWAI